MAAGAELWGSVQNLSHFRLAERHPALAAGHIEILSPLPNKPVGGACAYPSSITGYRAVYGCAFKLIDEILPLG